jgi:hypothetical protein
MDAKVIEQVVAMITDKAVTVEHAHMVKPWEMVLGGLIFPILVGEDPSANSNGQYEALMARYSKEEVEKVFSTPEAREVVKTVEVEKVKYVEVPVDTDGTLAVGRKPTLHGTVKSNGKFRRLKGAVAKVRRKKNDIPSEGRDLINIWWNTNQRLVQPGAECKALADEINRRSGIAPLSPSQVSGWISWLCRLALKTQHDFDDYISRALKIGKFTVIPKFSDALIDKIANNKARIAEERRLAREAKRRMAAEAARATA